MARLLLAPQAHQAEESRYDEEHADDSHECTYNNEQTRDARDRAECGWEVIEGHRRPEDDRNRPDAEAGDYIEALLSGWRPPRGLSLLGCRFGTPETTKRPH